MAPSRPGWVVKDLADILGFDTETITQAILPDLESQTLQVKLQSHLQDFLGPTPKAKSFIERYITLRFPDIPTPTPTLPPPLKKKTQSQSQSQSQSRSQSKPSTPRYQATLAPDLNAVNDAFGNTGRIYSKNREADHASAATAGGSGTGSGIGTPPPQFRHPGALTIHEVQPRSRSGKGKEREGGKGKVGGDKIWDIPKSKSVLNLEKLRDRLQRVSAGEKVHREGKDVDVADCFCQARVHTLSTYTPHCSHCGLILCSVQPIYLPCPSCSSPLYSLAQLSRLLLRLATEIEHQLDTEQAERDTVERQNRQRLLAESGGGAFPTLSPTSTPGGGGAGGTKTPNEVRKVVTIGGGGKKGKTKITTTTYRPSPTPTASSAPSRATTPPVSGIVSQPRSPPFDAARIEKEWSKTQQWREETDRPWGDKKDPDVWTYVELPLSTWIEEGTEGRRKAAKKKKRDGERGVGIDGRVVPGAVGAVAAV